MLLNRNMFQNFQSRPRLWCIHNPYAELHHFNGGKFCGIDVPLNATNYGRAPMGYRLQWFGTNYSNKLEVIPAVIYF